MYKETRDNQYIREKTVLETVQNSQIQRIVVGHRRRNNTWKRKQKESDEKS